MSAYMNSLRAQRDRHDIKPGHYRVTYVRAHCAGSGRQQVDLGLNELQAGIHPVDGMPIAFIPHDPIVDALWNHVQARHKDVQRGNLTTTPIWVVELGKNAKVLGFARATSVFGIGKHYGGPYRYSGEPQDYDIYTVEEMRRKGHRY